MVVKNNGIHMSRLVGKSSVVGQKLMASRIYRRSRLWNCCRSCIVSGNSPIGSSCLVWPRVTREQIRDRDDAHRHSRAYFHAPCKEERSVVLPPEMWGGCRLEHGQLSVSLHGICDAAAHLEDAYACCRNSRLNVELRARARCYSSKRGTRIVVHGDDFMTGRPRDQLECSKSKVDKHFETEHTMMRTSSALGNSFIMLNRRLVWQKNGVDNIPDHRHCDRVGKALHLHHAKVVATPAVKENEHLKKEM